jgi:hypothetical protein
MFVSVFFAPNEYGQAPLGGDHPWEHLKGMAESAALLEQQQLDQQCVVFILRAVLLLSCGCYVVVG